MADRKIKPLSLHTPQILIMPYELLIHGSDQLHNLLVAENFVRLPVLFVDYCNYLSFSDNNEDHYGKNIIKQHFL